MMRFWMVAVVVGVSCLPRMAVGVVGFGRRVDIRSEDLVILLMILPVCLAKRLSNTPLLTLILGYLSVSGLSTIAGILGGELEADRAGLYFSKDLEYFLLYCVAAIFVTTRREVLWVLTTILICGVLNGAWACYQLGRGEFGSLLKAEMEWVSAAGLGNPHLGSYGLHLIGEGSPLSSGGFFAITALVALAAALHWRTNWRPMLSALTVVLATCCLLTGSRTAALILFVGLVVVLLRSGAKYKAQALLLVVAGGAAVMNWVPMELPRSRIAPQQLDRSLEVRTKEIWRPLLEEVISVRGVGVGFGRSHIRVEAHNHYLRLLVESGLPGLILFLSILISSIAIGRRLFRIARTPVARSLGAVVEGVGVGLCVAAFFNDVFMPVTLNEMWWLLVGVAAASLRLEYQALRREKEGRATMSAGAHWPGVRPSEALSSSAGSPTLQRI